MLVTDYADENWFFAGNFCTTLIESEKEKEMSEGERK